jgi:hypothetical protein
MLKRLNQAVDWEMFRDALNSVRRKHDSSKKVGDRRLMLS